jgi:hypothetical protein
MKTLTSFAPASRNGLAESERHYVDVHVPLARRWLAQVPWITQYMAYKPLEQRDANGGWRQRPAIWRYAMQRFAPDAAGTTFPEDVYARMAPDNLNCLSELRCFEVEEQVPLERVSGQTAFATYFVDVEAREGEDGTQERLDALVERLLERAGAHDGIRRLTVNRVTRETEAEAIEEPGQKLTDRFLPETRKLAILELVADGRAFGDALLDDPAVDEGLFELGRKADVACLAVQEDCGFDRRTA